MINVPYVEEGNCYIVTNFADSNNPITTCQEEATDFKSRSIRHLEKIAEIMAFSIHNDHYQIVLVMKDRSKHSIKDVSTFSYYL